jgi:hypothetical protein
MMVGKTPKILKEIRTDIDNTYTELRRKYFILDESSISYKAEHNDEYRITYATKENAENVIYDKNIPYNLMIDKLLEQHQYALLFYDKSIIQLGFDIVNNEVVKERLVFIKKHNKMWSREEITEAEKNGTEWFDDNYGFPILFRIDYDKKNAKDIEHPAVHFTVSNHESCRIPVCNIVSFSDFIKFVLFNFYKETCKISSYRFSGQAITHNEQNLFHISWN